MRKKTSLLIFLLVAAVFVDFSVAKEVPITEENTPLLKGWWGGDRSASFGSTTKYRKTEVEIINSVFPLEGAVVLHFDMGKPERIEFKNGILRNGRIFIQRENVQEWWVFWFYSKGEKMELRGEYQIVKAGGYLLTGNFILRKK